MRLPKPDNRLYLGRGGSGKTSLALEHAAQFDRVLMVRPDDSEPPRFPSARSSHELARAMSQDKFRLCINAYMSVENWELANEAAIAAGDTVVIWEEAHLFIRSRSLMDFAPHAFNLWMHGRHFGCRVFAISIRPAGLTADLRANLARAVIFNTTEEADLQFYRHMIPDRSIIPKLDFAHHDAVDWTTSGYAVKRAPFP
ncbi:MAG TPA: hypothetical protein VGL83_08050 [Stellaceae bacterium]|jgi:hypothetical protein